MAVNMIAPLVLVLGILYTGQYRDSLISADLETLKAHAQLFAGAVAESAVRPVDRGRPFMFARPEEIEALSPELSRRIIRRLSETTGSHARIFDQNGKILADSLDMGPPGKPARTKAPPPSETKKTISNFVRYMAHNLLLLFPTKSSSLPLYPQLPSIYAKDYPDAAEALRGRTEATAWEAKGNDIILSAATPVRYARQVMGAVMLTKDADDIEAAMIEVRVDVLTMFLVALSITILLSIYLAGVIGRPLRKLAIAAENIRQEKSRHIDIPDLSSRHDEIGELSLALRDMTQALWDRMDSIEHFAADVAHEIKNPLTSLRSAVETVARVSSSQDRDRLMEIILHDVQRLDRLISDISSASRLDAELSRDEMGRVDLRRLLEYIADTQQAPLARGGENTGKSVRLDLPAHADISVYGNESRLVQVFQNLIANALSFSPDRPLVVRAAAEKKRVIIAVEDEGPGIPENKLETIFERFYSERPRHEDYGQHSGLGLSIAKQIVNAHGGEIFAENRHDAAGHVTGARFTVVLEAAA
jgi:two-component system, OmpR family, sensor histidine kinase ChvG